MAFGDGILQCLGLKNELSRCPFRVTLFGCEGAVIGGVKKIAKISDDEVVFLAGKKAITVGGKNLKITCYGESETAVSGVVTEIRLSDVGRE